MLMPFGRYRGRDVKDLPPDYVAWLLANAQGALTGALGHALRGEPDPYPEETRLGELAAAAGGSGYGASLNGKMGAFKGKLRKYPTSEAAVVAFAGLHGDERKWRRPEDLDAFRSPATWPYVRARFLRWFRDVEREFPDWPDGLQWPSGAAVVWRAFPESPCRVVGYFAARKGFTLDYADLAPGDAASGQFYRLNVSPGATWRVDGVLPEELTAAA